MVSTLKYWFRVDLALVIRVGFVDVGCGLLLQLCSLEVVDDVYELSESILSEVLLADS